MPKTVAYKTNLIVSFISKFTIIVEHKKGKSQI